MRRRGVTLVDVVVVVDVLFVCFLFFAAAIESLGHGHGKSNQTKCGNNLRQLGMAAIQYADDKRFFPHMGKPKELDGGYKSSTATRVVRSLMYFNYHDNPENFVCPSSPDMSHPLSKAARADIRAFRWQGVEAPAATVSPLVEGGEEPGDGPLDRSTDLSYGWTRKFYGTSARGSCLLAADKSRLHHKDLMLAVGVDSHLVRIQPGNYSPDLPDTRTISATEGPGAGFLGVLGDDPALGQ